MMKKISLIAGIVGYSLLAAAQPGTVKPMQPTQSDNITVTYQTNDPQAVLNNREPLYVRVTNFLEDGDIQKFHVRLNVNGSTATNVFKLPAQTASFTVEFYSLNKDDDKAAHNMKVYTADHRQPVKGAYMQDFFTDRPDSLFQLEIKNYPANYLAYAKYINVISMVKPATATAEITAIIKKLEAIYPTDKSAGLLSALCVGYAKTSNLNNGKAYLFNLFEQYPAAAETAFAFSIYNYEYYKTSGKDVEEDVRQRLKAIFTTYPDAAIAKNENVLYQLQQDKTIPVTAFERALKPLYARDEITYHGFNTLPEIYIAGNVKLDSAAILLNLAIKQFQDGTINHQYRLNNGHYQMYVPYMILNLVKINLLKADYSSAITNASAAINMLTGSNTEGNFVPLLLPLRATAYRKSGNLNLAFEDYKRLYRAGGTAALDSMRVIFAQCDLPQKTFEQFEASLKPGAKSATPAPALPLAPEFTATDLQGRKISMSALKGKTVVINIWGIGCGPCIAEMPKLNELVKHYAARKDVVFLAITGDKTADLQRFFKTRKFDYTVVNNAGNLNALFNTTALPVHIVVSKKGEIVSRSIGARDDIKAYLQQIIDSN